jgi:hypothetical protein
MKFSVFDVMDKGLYLKQTLEAAGHEPVRFDDADVLILDCDWAWADPRPQLIDEAVARGLKVALYPHGGMPTVHVYDGLTKPTRASIFASSTGSAASTSPNTSASTSGRPPPAGSTVPPPLLARSRIRSGSCSRRCIRTSKR